MSIVKDSVVIKIGGAVLDRKKTIDELSWNILKLKDRFRFILVHGGGKEITKQLKNCGIESKFSGGLRITTDKEIDIIDNVITNKINKNIIHKFQNDGINVIGLSGENNNLFEIEPAVFDGITKSRVGKIVNTKKEILLNYLDKGIIPVVSPICMNSHNKKFNVNADEVAYAIATAIKAKVLIFISDVSGVYVNGKLINPLNIENIHQLIKKEIATGGMAVKLKSSANCIQKGVEKVIITNWAGRSTLINILENKKKELTVIKRGGIKMADNQWIQLSNEVLIQSYHRPNILIERGDGIYLYDSKGRRYIDFISSVAVSSLGHSDKDLINKAVEQLNQLWHCSNLYHSRPHIELAKLLTEKTFADKVFFVNSGAEAVETALKFARKWAYANKGEECYEFICFKNSFHGRSYGALSATGNENYWIGYKPLVPGIKFAEMNNINSVKELISEKICAILIEPIQGEGGIHPATKEFIQEIKELSTKHNFLLIFDEIQCGLGRTGYFNAYEYYEIEPDIMTIAKPLGGGLPIGVTLTTNRIAENIKPGDHGSTFGGNPVITAVAVEIIKKISNPSLLENVKVNGEYLMKRLNKVKEKTDKIVEVRGRGFMVGIQLNEDPTELVNKCIENGLFICKSCNSTARMLPPLITTKEQIDEAIEIFTKVITT